MIYHSGVSRKSAKDRRATHPSHDQISRSEFEAPGSLNAKTLKPSNVLQLQRLVGNRRVLQLMREPTPSSSQRAGSVSIVNRAQPQKIQRKVGLVSSTDKGFWALDYYVTRGELPTSQINNPQNITEISGKRRTELVGFAKELIVEGYKSAEDQIYFAIDGMLDNPRQAAELISKTIGTDYPKQQPPQLDKNALIALQQRLEMVEKTLKGVDIEFDIMSVNIPGWLDDNHVAHSIFGRHKIDLYPLFYRQSVEKRGDTILHELFHILWDNIKHQNDEKGWNYNAYSYANIIKTLYWTYKED